MLDDSSNTFPTCEDGASSLAAFDIHKTIRNGVHNGPLHTLLAHASASEPDFGELFPLMASFKRDESLRKGQPFQDVFLLCRLHATTSAVPALDALKAWGLDPKRVVYFIKDYPYAHGEMVQTALRSRGATVLPDDELSVERLDSFAEVIRRDDFRVITIEDGAEIVHLLHQNKYLRSRWVGGAEQTTRGTWRIDTLADEGKLKKPVVALSHSKIKSEFEGPRIPASGLRACQNLFPHVCVGEWKVAVLGTGTIGRHTISAFEEFGCEVSAYDPDPNMRLRVRHFRAGVLRRSAEEAVTNAHLILGTAGKLTVTSDVISRARGHVRIGSLSSERVEVDVRWLENYAERKEPLLLHPKGFPNNVVIGTRYILPPHGSRMVDLIFDGMPLNFSEYGVLCEKYTDLIVGWLMLCGLEIARGTYSHTPGLLKDAADQVFNKHQLAEQFERIWN